MKCYIGFEELSVQCIIGDLPEERTEKQVILVDLKVLANVGEEDHLEATVDYCLLASECARIAEKGKYQMLEAYAAAVLRELMQKFALENAKIRVRKPKGLSEAKWAFVEMEV